MVCRELRRKVVQFYRFVLFFFESYVLVQCLHHNLTRGILAPAIEAQNLNMAALKVKTKVSLQTINIGDSTQTTIFLIENKCAASSDCRAAV